MELGSEYNLPISELNIKENNLFHYLEDYNSIYTDSGRSALKIFFDSIMKGGEILMPEFICECVINCFDKDKIKFYRIDNNCQIDLDDLLDKITKQTKAILLMHYFGSLQDNNTLISIREAADKRDILIIEDTTHSIFSSKETIGDYMVASIRKWMPIALGGVLYSKNFLPDVSGFHKSNDDERLYGMILKDLFLKDVLECNSVYRGIFRRCEENLDEKKETELLSDLSRFIISCIDISVIKENRKDNYNYLRSKLGKMGINPICDLSDDDCPFAYPLRVGDRDKFRMFLMDNQIYCAVHWPFDNFKIEERLNAVLNANTLISLPIDQRYGKPEMDYLIDTVKSYGGALSL